MSHQILKDIIEDFQVEKVVRFLRTKNNKFRFPNEPFYFEENAFQEGRKIAEANLEDGNLIVCSFLVNQNLSERSGKKAQYELGKKILKGTQSDAGIFIFYDNNGNFRFSLIYTNYLGRRRDWSNYRRFTYFVSKQLTNKTFLQRIGKGDFSTLEKIKEAFSVEKVTKEFFEEFRVYFEKTKREFERSNRSICLWLKDRYSQEEYEEQINKFAYTFLGRIIFIYFLQRKGWIEGKINYIRDIVKDKNNSLLYLTQFQPLFFDVFAKKEDERPPAIREQFKNTPYLNGGLFEKSELELQLERHNKFILFSDEFIRDIILNFFEAYNFTIDENSPDDQEVSIDPEMLGKVFENTLAEKERGKKGTFYTPREIVHFMVKDSLWHFLKNETDISPEKLHDLIYSKKELEKINFTKEQIRQIDKKLENIKVLDPAVGSGAFPVEMMQVLVELRKKLNVTVGKNINEVFLKKKFIKNNLYGVDIDPGAIEIAKLRLWLSLIVDYDKSEVEPLPNLDFQFRLGNSLQEKIADIDIFNETQDAQISFPFEDSEVKKIKNKMIAIKDRFYDSEDEKEKRRLKEEFDKIEHRLIEEIIKRYKTQLSNQLKNSYFRNAAKQIQVTLNKIENLKQKVKDGTYKLFKPDFHFSEVFDRKDEQGNKIGGFDIVIGNPPYGVKVDNDIKEWHKLGSKDSYGVFISTSLKRFLKPGGVLSFITSDTWLTIKTHKQLRQQVLEKRLHKVIRLHQDCFDATVNACIFTITNSPTDDGDLIVADLTNISTRKEVEKLRDKLYNLEKFVGTSTPKFAVYKYKQNLIKVNSNLPIFVGSPKLFTLMNDTTCQVMEKEINGKKVKVRQIKFNDKLIELVRFGDIAEIKQGLATGDNKYYLFQNPEARGSYKNINDYKQYLLTEEDLKRIRNNEELRLKVIEKGFHKSRNEKDFDEDLWFGGRYIIPYDKGGESDTESGWLPNYYVPTNYFIDWSQEAVRRMKTLTIRQRDGKGKNKVCSRFQNKEYYFKEGITFSTTGMYAPTFRIINGIISHKSSGIFYEEDISKDIIYASLFSKLIKYIAKVYINHVVDFTEDPLSKLILCPKVKSEILDKINQIIQKQKQNPRYDYMSNEQKEIDRLVYEMYGLNEDDVCEVETWYARRYPKLAKFCNIG